MKHEGKMKGHTGDCWTDEFQNFEPLPARYATLEWRCNTCDRPMSRVLSRAECKGPVAPKPSPEQCDPCRLEQLLRRIEAAEAAVPALDLCLARQIYRNSLMDLFRDRLEPQFSKGYKVTKPFGFKVADLVELPEDDAVSALEMSLRAYLAQQERERSVK